MLGCSWRSATAAEHGLGSTTARCRGGPLYGVGSLCRTAPPRAGWEPALSVEPSPRWAALGAEQQQPSMGSALQRRVAVEDRCKRSDPFAERLPPRGLGTRSFCRAEPTLGCSWRSATAAEHGLGSTTARCRGGPLYGVGSLCRTAPPRAGWEPALSVEPSPRWAALGAEQQQPSMGSALQRRVAFAPCQMKTAATCKSVAAVEDRCTGRGLRTCRSRRSRSAGPSTGWRSGATGCHCPGRCAVRTWWH